MATNIKHVDSKKYQKALTFEDRVSIKNIIETHREADGSMTLLLNDIGNMLEKDPTTISKEVKMRRTPIILTEPSPTDSRYCFFCKDNNKCKENKVFRTFGEKCLHFKRNLCKYTKKFPWVCNGCRKKGYCKLPKSYYNPIPANDSYRMTLVESREGIYLKENEFKEIDSILSNGLSKKQSIEHIIHSNNIQICVKTAYNYLNKGYLSSDKLNTHRMVRLKGKDNQRPYNSKILREKKIGKQYDDFTKLIASNPGIVYTEMDTVIGKPGGKVILSLKVINVQLQFYFLLEDKSAKSVVDKLNEIQSIIGIENYKTIFGIILTDNGAEFTDIDGIMYDSETGELRTKLYFCHPQCSGEKGSCERSHELLRYIIPKGYSFDSYNQETFNKITSHVNSIKRKSTDFSTPIELFRAHFGNEILSKLDISLIDPNSVILSFELLK